MGIPTLAQILPNFIEMEPLYRDYVKFGYVIENKYIKSEFLKSKKKARPEIKWAIETATDQLDQYSPYNNCTTTKIILVASAKKNVVHEDKIERLST